LPYPLARQRQRGRGRGRERPRPRPRPRCQSEARACGPGACFIACSCFCDRPSRAGPSLSVDDGRPCNLQHRQGSTHTRGQDRKGKPGRDPISSLGHHRCDRPASWERKEILLLDKHITPLPFIQSLPHYFQNASISFSFFSISGPQQLKGKCLLYCYGSCSCCSWSCLRRGLIQASHCTECDSWARGLHATGGAFSSLSPESWSYRSAR
jgi:hypothetical protein